MNITVEQMHPLVLNVGRAVHNADWNWQNVCSPFTRIFYIAEGSAWLLMNGERIQLVPGRLYMVPAFTNHGYHCDSHFVLYYVHIYEELHDGTACLTDMWQMPVEVEGTPLTAALAERLCQINPLLPLAGSDPACYDNPPTLQHNLMVNRGRPFADKVESRGIVLQLLSPFLRRATPRMVSHDPRIVAAVDYILHHLTQPLSVAQLADQTCLTKNHFIRLFRRETGQTPLHYINGRKMERAQIILATEPLPVKTVALRLAFDDYSYFNRLFKKMTGVTPQNYRNSVQAHGEL